MAAQNTLSAITSFTHKPKPQLLKPAHLHTTLVPAHRHTWSVTTSDGLKWGSKSLKANEFFCKCTSRPLLQISCFSKDDQTTGRGTTHILL